MKLSDKIETIAVFRALQLGDMLCSIPAIRALRHSYPHAHITLLGLPWTRSWASRFKHYFNDFVYCSGFPGLSEQSYNPAESLRFLRTIHRRRFDLLLQMHGNGNIVNPLLKLGGAKQYAGFYREDNYCPDPETFMPYPADTNPELLRHLQLMEFLGLPTRGTALEFPLLPQDYRDFNRLHLPLRRLQYVVLHPGARADTRLWSPAYFARLGDRAGDYGFEVVITGVESERDITAEVIRRMNHPPVDLTGRTSLGALGVLVREARLVIANDTGISHIADALHTPSIIVSLSYDPERWTPLDGHLHTYFRCRDEDCFEGALHCMEKHLTNQYRLLQPSS